MRYYLPIRGFMMWALLLQLGPTTQEDKLHLTSTYPYWQARQSHT